MLRDDKLKLQKLHSRSISNFSQEFGAPLQQGELQAAGDALPLAQVSLSCDGISPSTIQIVVLTSTLN